jgi:GTP cyclohydrolase II
MTHYGTDIGVHNHAEWKVYLTRGNVEMKKPDGNGEVLQSKLPVNPGFIEREEYCKDEGSSAGDEEICVQLVATTQLPTRYGVFQLVGFFDTGAKKEHTALVKGDVTRSKECTVRIHSECHTGDVFGSLKCDCRDQLESSIKYISSQECGVLIYLKQEGRGIGLLNKIKAYKLQELGLDTVEANEFLGFPDDMREYGVAARIIQILGIKSVALLTNNPEKIKGLRKEGITIVRRIPLVVKPNNYNEMYLKTKRNKMGHLLQDSEIT